MKPVIVAAFLLVLFAAFITNRNAAGNRVNLPPNEQPLETIPPINDFKTCADAGNEVMESYPRRCQADDQIFTEELGNLDDFIDQIQVTAPKSGSKLTSPVTVTGQARGSWFFEAQFPIRVVDENNLEIGRSTATADSEWMTEDFVPFTATIALTPNEKSGQATIIIEKDNPSGLPENAAAVRIPVYY